jgi:IS30 family transposase
MLTLDEQLRRSVTWDQGREMTNHARFRRDRPGPTSVSRARRGGGTNENTVSLVVARLGWSGRLVPAA